MTETATHTVGGQVERHLARLYPAISDAARVEVAQRVLAAMGVDGDAPHVLGPSLPTEDEVVLITYGDTFRRDGQPHVRSLHQVIDRWFGDVFSTVHVLPFFTSSSDGGFSIVDYREVARALGDWSDLAAMVAGRGFMVDLVCNHGSAQSAWFRQFIDGEAPGRDWYVTASPDDDLSSVVRPRTHPLLLEVETPSGPRHVWATFSHDQVDFDFSNPEVLVEFCSIIAFYLANGATRVRLDAIAYLWKRLGTSCVHLPETHEVVKLMRTLTTASDPDVLLITETNVPHAQNVSYFGDGDEAQIVYNFTLAPLIVWSVLAEEATTLTGWLGRLGAPPQGCTFLNFIASHDGIGLRPIEDLVRSDDLDQLLEAARQVGGDWSMYSAPGGPRPYELNVSLADLLAGVDGANVDRYVLAHAIVLALQGVPAIYVHSMLATPGDHEAVARTEHKRDVNRPWLHVEEVDRALESGWRGDASARLRSLIRTRRGQPAFAPRASQRVHVLDDAVLAVVRGDGADRVWALHNVTAAPVTIELSSEAGRFDLVSGAVVPAVHGQLELEPWRACWLVDESSVR